MSKKRVLFLCTGNSCRSQMAEGLVNFYWSEQWMAYSAGTAPAGYVHPLAIQAMSELGIDISQQHSKEVSAYQKVRFDLVITVCDDAAENCPLWLGRGKVVHIGFPDPAGATGDEAAQLAVFQDVRDQIRSQIGQFLAGRSPSRTVNQNFTQP